MRIPTFFEAVKTVQCLLTEHEFEGGKCVHCGQKEDDRLA